jgi:hypothetical protein
MDTLQFSDSAQRAIVSHRYRFALQIMLILFLYHSVTSLSFMNVRHCYRRHSFARWRNFGISRSVTGSVVNATALTENPTGHTTKTVMIALTPVAGLCKMRSFRLESSSASPGSIYSVTNTVE